MGESWTFVVVDEIWRWWLNVMLCTMRERGSVIGGVAGQNTGNQVSDCSTFADVKVSNDSPYIVDHGQG